MSLQDPLSAEMLDAEDVVEVERAILSHRLLPDASAPEEPLLISISAAQTRFPRFHFGYYFLWL